VQVVLSSNKMLTNGASNKEGVLWFGIWGARLESVGKLIF
jgi:hypothetical protein